MLRRLFEKRFHVSEEPPGWITKGWGYDTAVGVDINEDNALEVTAVYACVRILAETIASLPLITYRRLQPRGKERAPDFSLYPILHDSPNPEMTAFDMREALQGQLALRGNAYAEIEVDNGGAIRHLWPLRADKISILRLENGRLVYDYRLPDKFQEVRRLPAERVLHLRGFGSGLMGYSPIRLARNSVGLAKATEEFGGRFFGNGARPGGVLEHPGKLTDTAHKRMKESWNESQGGLSNAHRIAILEEGISYKQIGLAPEDSQFLETRKFQVAEIARIFRIPPHMLADLERATFSNIEHLGLEFVIYTLRPWLVRWEQRIRLSLLTEKERESYFVEHLVDGLLRGDFQSRQQGYATGRQWGWFSVNDVRELENLNPVAGGDARLQPLNMVTAGSSGQDGRGGPQIAPQITQIAQMGEARQTPQQWDEARGRQSAATRHRLAGSYRKLYVETAGRVLRREVNDVRALARKLLDDRGGNKRSEVQFLAELERFYREHAEFTMRQFRPLAEAYGELVAAEAQEEVDGEVQMTPELERFVHSYVGGFAAREGGISQSRIRRALQRALDDGNLRALDEIEREMEDWEEARSSQIADEESIRYNNALAKTVYAMAGRQFLRSVAFGKSCPYCMSLDGKIIGINEFFIKAGESLQPEGVEAPLTSTTDLGHAPYHGGCLPGDSLVSTVGPVSAASKRWFDGNLVVIHTAGSRKLTCTPNHPILTPGGWVAANGLNVGSYVIGSGFGQRTVTIDEGRQNEPARIEDIAKAFFDDPEVLSVSVPLTTEDFHGDGAGSEIAIIGSYGDLRYRFDAARGKHFPEVNFIGGFDDGALLCPSGHAHLLVSFDPASGSPVSSRGLTRPLIGGYLAGAQLTSGAVTANLDTRLNQSQPDEWAGELQFIRERILGFTGKIFSDEVIDIEIVPFSGHVYNLQTDDGFYIADGIVTHNCDCLVAAG